MNVVPLVHVKYGRLHEGLDGDPLTVDEVFARVQKDTMLYVLDSDGIDHGNPDLELYQQLTEHCILWVDDGPRRIDDVMDTIMAGATNLTIRPDHWPEVNIDEIFDLTDDEVFYAVPLGQKDQAQRSTPVPPGAGIVAFFYQAGSQEDFTTDSYLKNIGINRKLYLYRSSAKSPSGWEEQTLAGLVVDLKNLGGTS
jgi:hypothetical protein